MNPSSILKLLEQISRGEMTPDAALDSLRDLPFADLDIAKHDNHRALRNGFSETIFCEGKDESHLMRIVEGIVARGVNVLGTRAAPDVGARLAARFPEVDYDPVSRTFVILKHEKEVLPGRLAVVCAGTADLPVAEEARRTAEFFGMETIRRSDIGVAGLHRLMGAMDELRAADAIVAVAGMEGALPSVLGGLVAVPIIAVPTSVGYGANFGGVTAMLAMLNSCSEGIAVVNIDNGFGAACAALRILRTRK